MPGSETRFAVLLFTDIVGSTELKARHGVPAYSEALRAHNGHFERISHECLNIRTLQSRGDGYFAEAGSIAEAVRFALLFEEAMREGPWGEVRLAVRVGIHAGEIGMLNQEDGTWIVGPAADLAARITDLAMAGQILLTRFPFDEARHFIREHPPVAGKTMPPLRWLAHGPYLLKGRDEPMDIFEVGAEGFAPLVAPPDGDKAKRAIRPGEEETLGWRPAVGLEIPGRTGWQLTERLGAGGFGEVWTGEHAKLHQRRAFKFCFDDERLRALKREVTLVRLLRSALGERDDIVHIHELKLDAPPFYLESDLAPHGNLLQWAERQGGLGKIPLAQRIALVAHTATALAAAHSIGVLHKDIKPTNILIFDGPGDEPRPRLVDFGIGTLTDRAVLGEHGVTAAGFTRTKIEHSTGTPTYSPPEYLAGKPYTIQGDIYGLGVLLYQLITVRPLDPLAQGWEREIADSLLREDIAACVDGDPARRLPSAADLAERLMHLDQRRAEIEERDRLVRAEVVEKERLAREAAARAEAEAAAVAARIRATRLRKLTTAFGVLTLLSLAGGVLAWMALGEVGRKKAEVDRKNTEQRAMLVEAARSDRLVAEEVLQAGQEREAFAHLARACEYDAISTLAAEKATVALNMWQHPLPTAILATHEKIVSSAQFSPDCTRILTDSSTGIARLWDADTGNPLATFGVHYDVEDMPDMRIETLEHTSPQFSPDGTRIVTDGKIKKYGADRKNAHVWDATTGRSIATLEGHRPRFSPDGTRIVTGSFPPITRLWEASTGRFIATLEGSLQRFSPDGTRIVTTSTDKTARVWDAATGASLAVLAGHEGKLSQAEFSPDGTRIVTASEDKTARVWDAATGVSLTILVGHEGKLHRAEFSPDGTRIVTASEDKTAFVWNAATGKSLAVLTGHRGELHRAEFSPDSTRVLTASRDKTARVWDGATGTNLATLEGYFPQFSPDGTHIVTDSRGKTPQVWDVATGQPVVTLEGHSDALTTWPQFSPDGTRIVTVSKDKTARVWDAATGNPVATLNGHADDVRSALFSGDGTRIITRSREGVRVWNVAFSEPIATTEGHANPRSGKHISPDGKRIISVEGGTTQVWDAATGKVIATLEGGGSQFSPDGTRIVTATRDKTARVWEAATGKSLATLAGHQGAVNSVEFSPDNLRIVTSSLDATVRIWEAATGKLIGTLKCQPGDVSSAGFSADGTHIIAVSGNKTERSWNILPPSAGPPPDWFPDFLRYMAQMRLNSDGELETLKSDDWLALRERMRAVRRAGAGQDTPYLRILRRFVPE